MSLLVPKDDSKIGVGIIVVCAYLVLHIVGTAIGSMLLHNPKHNHANLPKPLGKTSIVLSPSLGICPAAGARGSLLLPNPTILPKDLLILGLGLGKVLLVYLFLLTGTQNTIISYALAYAIGGGSALFSKVNPLSNL